MKNIIFVFIILSGCSPKPADNNVLPSYSDMGAATDAGNVK